MGSGKTIAKSRSVKIKMKYICTYLFLDLSIYLYIYLSICHHIYYLVLCANSYVYVCVYNYTYKMSSVHVCAFQYYLYASKCFREREITRSFNMV